MFKSKAPADPIPTWEEQKAKLKMRFPQITDQELNFPAKKKLEMLTNLQIKVKRSAKELLTLIETP